ncbi:hypothetical protein XELAEV_18006537mg [Xenopus laevis]|uniref:Uncharacterized protein n=1 Tax=Xenopus laevis TaxID=8355 RepID=A0A974I3L7_XENLA|nr:hypothetical protein XELAEV_18006537mg [Xenopus laevis]
MFGCKKYGSDTSPVQGHQQWPTLLKYNQKSSGDSGGHVRSPVCPCPAVSIPAGTFFMLVLPPNLFTIDSGSRVKKVGVPGVDYGDPKTFFPKADTSSKQAALLRWHFEGDVGTAVIGNLRAIGRHIVIPPPPNDPSLCVIYTRGGTFQGSNFEFI